MKKLLWVKFGWSEYYQGGPVEGNFGWLKQAKGTKSEGKGHEAVNFLPTGGNYYCYVPPQGGRSAPWNEDNVGWTVVCLAKKPNQKGVHIVGWYEDATLLGDWLKSPHKFQKKSLNAAHPGYDWSYCIESKTAFFVPPEFRVEAFSDISIRTAKYSYLKGPNIGEDENKKRVLKILQERLSNLRKVAIHNPNLRAPSDPELNKCDPLIGFGTAENRKRVEKAAEKAVISHFKRQGFECTDMTKTNCGYDFCFYKNAEELHVEVKGTSGPNARFFLTRNEYDSGYQSNSKWRLAMVTNTLSEPHVEIFTPKQVKDKFELTPYVYTGNIK